MNRYDSGTMCITFQDIWQFLAQCSGCNLVTKNSTSEPDVLFENIEIISIDHNVDPQNALIIG